MHVDIFHGNIVLKIPGFDAFANVVQFRTDGQCCRFRDDPLFCEHGHMGLAAHDVMPVQPLVKRNGFRQTGYIRLRILTESSAPQCHI